MQLSLVDYQLKLMYYILSFEADPYIRGLLAEEFLKTKACKAVLSMITKSC